MSERPNEGKAVLARLRAVAEPHAARALGVADLAALVARRPTSVAVERGGRPEWHLNNAVWDRIWRPAWRIPEGKL